MTRLRSLIGLETRKIILIIPVITALAVAGAKVGTAIAAQAPAASASNSATDPDAKRKEKNVAAGEAEARALLLLMDRDKNGKVSKQEFMSFMEAEFTRLDVNKDGELDVNELIQSRLTPRGGVHR